MLLIDVFVAKMDSGRSWKIVIDHDKIIHSYGISERQKNTTGSRLNAKAQYRLTLPDSELPVPIFWYTTIFSLASIPTIN